MTPEDISARIRSALPDAEVRVVDTTGGGDHFSATVVSSAFADKGLVERHRLVYAALGEAMRGSHAPIHALALTTDTPEEYRRK
jgi:stress-induced morphogen